MPTHRKNALLALMLAALFAFWQPSIVSATTSENAATFSKVASGSFSEQGNIASAILPCNSNQALGKTASATTTRVCAFSYGKEADQLSRLNYYGYRYYDPLSLTWTQADPLYRVAPDIAGAEPRRMSLYAFSLNNPLRYLDPDGRSPYGAYGSNGAKAGSTAPYQSDRVALSIMFPDTQIVEQGQPTNSIEKSHAQNSNRISSGAIVGAVAVADFTMEVLSLGMCDCSSEGTASKNHASKDVKDNYSQSFRRNHTVQHASRKKAKEAARHAHGGKPKPTPKKTASREKKDTHKESQKTNKPESHPDSAHPEPHFHDSNKSKQKDNAHHTYPPR